MRKLYLFPLLVVLILNSGWGRSKLGPRDVELQMTYGGVTREYILHVPVLKAVLKETQKKRALVLALHGGGGTAKGMLKLTGGRFNELADRDGFYVIYPQGLGKSWNEGSTDSKGYAREHKIDDAGFLNALIDEISKKYPIDPARVFSTGISNGGLMSYRLACQMPGKIRAIAPIAASLPEDLVSMCRDAKGPGVGLLILNGTEDPIMPYNGGAIQVFWQTRGKIISSEETARLWTEKNGCSAAPQKFQLADRDPNDGTRVISHSYGTCRSGAPVVLFEIQGGGHTWPGGWQYLREKRIGKTSRDIFADDEIWSFFSSFK